MDCFIPYVQRSAVNYKCYINGQYRGQSRSNVNAWGRIRSLHVSDSSTSLFNFERPRLESFRVEQVTGTWSLTRMGVCQVQDDVSVLWHVFEDLFRQFPQSLQLVELLDSLVLSLKVWTHFVQDQPCCKHINFVCQTNWLVCFLWNLNMMHRLLRGLIHWSSCA
jgi:hypothetical protein